MTVAVPELIELGSRGKQRVKNRRFVRVLAYARVHMLHDSYFMFPDLLYRR